MIRTGADIIDLIYATETEILTIPVVELDPAFFDLSTGVAGEIAQKLVNYQQRAVIVGDLPEHSAAFADFVRECNRGRHLRFQ